MKLMELLLFPIGKGTIQGIDQIVMVMVVVGCLFSSLLLSDSDLLLELFLLLSKMMHMGFVVGVPMALTPT